MNEGNPRWCVLPAHGPLAWQYSEPTNEAIAHELNADEVGVLGMPDGLDCVVHNAKSRDYPDGSARPLNARATALLQSVLWPGYRVVGDVAITGLMAMTDDSPLGLSAQAIVALSDKYKK